MSFIVIIHDACRNCSSFLYEVHANPAPCKTRKEIQFISVRHVPRLVCQLSCTLCIHTRAAIPQMHFAFVKAFADSVSSQKRAAADGECREECLLQETATKEAAMATRMEEVQAELKQSRLALGNADAEIERLGVFSSQLKKVLPFILTALPEPWVKAYVPRVFLLFFCFFMARREQTWTPVH